MIAQGGGTILTMGSINGRTPAPSMAVYATIKGGIEAFTRQIAVEYGPQGIRANTLCPGFITDARREAEFVTKPKEKARATSVIPLRRLGTAQDVADAALFLTSPQAAWITGQTLTIDGGQSVQNHRSVTHPFEAMTRDLP
jgi:NAD(P)-dependent dehydrogenase (short-subunit alcohol dehydrogenase family)